ncbi:MAG: phosphoribosylformylglycinamidine synthase II [Alphaproteobacteria bacterium]|jgi:phosphoribosylformylglycinamidine synthase II
MTQSTPEAANITPELVAEHGLKPDEYQRLLEIMGREPSLTELGIFSVMWSEHCSYKSSRFWLKQLPTSGSQVIQGPGENAGIVDLGDGDCAVFKMESHNHPSYIEPYQGAATGVGGIMRDVFTMGARPVANLNALRFGAPEHPKTRHLVNGVVSGIGGYGNCVGVPTVGGEVNFDAAYNNNILVNAMCIGLAKTDKIFYSAARGADLPVVYVGSKTGRDGIHGATMASAEFDDDSDEKRPTVQVGDPFTEKLLIEACLELMALDVIIAIQDMGAAGLTSSTSEMADKGGVGIELNLDHVPQREVGMTAYEMLLSESQERMLMVLKPGSEPDAEAVFRKWGLDFAVIGRTNDSGRMVVKHKGIIEADIPVANLADSAPLYERPWTTEPPPRRILAEWIEPPESVMGALKTIMAHPSGCSRRWVWEQYDHMVMGDTIQRPGGDAAVVRIHGTNKAIAACCDVTPRYVLADPAMGTKQAVAETWRNLTAVGAEPLAITDNLNYANPERPEIMGQFVQSIKGMTEACEVLAYPVVAGNVSLYNETNGVGIPPTPAIGGVGIIKDISKRVDMSAKHAGNLLVALGAEEGHLGQTLYQQIIAGGLDGAPPPVDLHAEKATGDFVRTLIREQTIHSVHDISDGGLLVAIAEMALAGNVGVEIFPYEGTLPAHAIWFGEDQARYVIEVTPETADGILERTRQNSLPARIVGRLGGDKLSIGRAETLELAELKSAHEAWFPEYMDSVSN